MRAEQLLGCSPTCFERQPASERGRMMTVDRYQHAARRVGDEGASALGITGEPRFIEDGALSDAAR
jgi:hypothetical protein